MSAWRSRYCGIIAGAGAALAVSACGGAGQAQDAHEPNAQFKVVIAAARFPASQRLAQHTHLVIAVRNTGAQTIPNVAVTICNVTCAYPAPPGEGSSVGAFSSAIDQPQVADPSRPTWIIDRSPGACGFSCHNGGQGAAVTAYSNTWALGRLAPGQTARFDWGVTAVKAGHHVVAWQVAAGLNGKARAVLADGTQPHGSFAVHVVKTPLRFYVNDQGQIITVR